MPINKRKINSIKRNRTVSNIENIQKTQIHRFLVLVMVKNDIIKIRDMQ